MAQSRCEHGLEYGQEYDDVTNQVIRVRCLECGYQSLSLFQPTDRYRFKKKEGVSDDTE